MSDIVCPHCKALNPTGSNFCESCGKALPSGLSGGPRVVDQGGIASTGAGQSLQAAELKKQMKSARGALLAVAIIQIVAGVLIYFLLSAAVDNPRAQITQADVNLTMAVIGVIAVIYFGLWAWAKSAPFPAALTGLVLYVTLWLGEAIIEPQSIARGILIKIIIIAVLGKAVQAGLNYRRLLAASNGRVE